MSAEHWNMKWACIQHLCIIASVIISKFIEFSCAIYLLINDININIHSVNYFTSICYMLFSLLLHFFPNRYFAVMWNVVKAIAIFFQHYLTHSHAFYYNTTKRNFLFQRNWTLFRFHQNYDQIIRYISLLFSWMKLNRRVK